MAQWTASSNSFVRPYRNAIGAPTIRYFEASTIAAPTKCGELVQFDTAVATASHRITRAQSTGGNGANLLGINGNNLLGVTIESDTSDGSTLGLGAGRKIGVALFNNHTEFLGYTRWAGPLASTMIGQTRSIIYDSTLKIWQIDSTNSTAALQTALITDIPEQYIGDSGAPVIFKIAISSLVNAIALG